MTREELVRRFRHDVDDTGEPYMWSHDWVIDALDDAVVEAAVRKRLLYAAGDPVLCRITLTPGTSVYPLHPALYELVDVRLKGACRPDPLRIMSVEALTDIDSEWRDRTGQPRWLIQDDTTLRFVPTPDTAGIVELEGYRLPLEKLDDDGSVPEIHSAHHRMLLEWVKYMAYSIPDTDKIDLERAGVAERNFTQYFGIRPDAGLRRKTREDEFHHNRLWP